MFKTIKNRSINLKIIRWIVFLAVVVVLFFQLRNFNWKQAQTLKLEGLWYFILAISLVWFNWFLEWKKWIFGMESIDSFDDNVLKKGFYAGMLAGFLTPSALGNFLGRISAFHPQWKNKITTITFFGNFSQFVISVFFGICSFFLIPNLGQLEPTFFSFIGLFFCIIVLLLSFFFIDKVALWQRYLLKKIPTLTSVSLVLRGKLILFSGMRFLIFSSQFYLIIKSFQVDVAISTLFWIWQLYFWTTLSPSLFLGKLFIRESLAIYILTFGGVELPVALISSIFIWLINNVIPSVFAYFKWRKYDLV